MTQGTGLGDGVSDRDNPADLSTGRLVAALAGASAVEAASKARFLALLGEFLDRHAWEDEGCVSAAQWLSWRCGLGSVAASEHIRVAQTLRCLPSIAQALNSGAITWSKVRAVTRIAIPATETTWLDVALDATAAQVEQIVRTQRRIKSADADHQEATRSLSWRQADDDGSLVITLRIPAAEGAAVIAAVQGHATPEAGVPIAARRADALVELVLGPEIATPTVTIVTTAETFAPGQAGDDDGDGVPGSCATDTGIAIDPGTAAAAACDGPVITADPDGAYRQQRYPTTATRRLLALRDPTCRFPGCHHTGRREAHHLTHWIHGGSRHPEQPPVGLRRPSPARPPPEHHPPARAHRCRHRLGGRRSPLPHPRPRRSPNRGPDPRQTPTAHLGRPPPRPPLDRHLPSPADNRQVFCISRGKSPAPTGRSGLNSQADRPVRCRSSSGRNDPTAVRDCWSNSGRSWRASARRVRRRWPRTPEDHHALDHSRGRRPSIPCDRCGRFRVNRTGLPAGCGAR